MLLNIVFIILGFLLLIKGGDWLVEGAVSIAKRAKLSPMVIGITIIGFGTSTPELLVSMQAALAGSPGLSIGNVVGSNIANIALILGVTALITPCITKKSTLYIDMPVTMLSCFLLLGVGMSGTISRTAGIIGVLMLIAFTSWSIRHSRQQAAKDPSAAEPIDDKPAMAMWKAILLTLISFGLLVAGANLLVKGASDSAMVIGQMVGADPKEMERIIGLTIVAVGTSFPELFASVIAARKRQTDMAVGNIIGSVFFNILCGIGLTATICPIQNSDQGFLVDYILMGILVVLLWLFMRTRLVLERWEGAVFLLIYVCYITHMIVA